MAYKDFWKISVKIYCSIVQLYCVQRAQSHTVTLAGLNVCASLYVCVWGGLGLCLWRGALVKGDLCQLRARDWGSAGCRHRGAFGEGGWKGRREGRERTDEKQEWEILNRGRLSERAKKLCKKSMKAEAGRKRKNVEKSSKRRRQTRARKSQRLQFFKHISPKHYFSTEKVFSNTTHTVMWMWSTLAFGSKIFLLSRYNFNFFCPYQVLQLDKWNLRHITCHISLFI